MISSMTGYGQASGEFDGIVYSVEIKAVNNRYLKTYVKLPEIASFVEDEVEKLLRGELNRGTVNCTIRMTTTTGEPMYDIDMAVMKTYIGKLKEVASEAQVPYEGDLTNLFNLPGAISAARPDEQKCEKINFSICELTVQALKALKKMRQLEGQSLADDLVKNCEIISQKLREVGLRSPTVLGEYHERLKKRANDLLSQAKLQIDSDMLAREVAVFAERCDIAEEVTRLDCHIAQFIKCCKGNGNSGRRLDFISQEMLREANTIASKSSDAQISQCVIDIKCAVDRIKEQVQNVE